MNNKQVVFLLSISLISFFGLSGKKLKLAIVDTTHLESFRYKPFIDIANSAGYQVDYKSIAGVLDSYDQLSLDSYDGVLFVLDIEFLKGMAKSFVSGKILNLIEIFGKKENKLVGFAFPPIGARLANKVALFSPVFNKIGLVVESASFSVLPSEQENLSESEQAKVAKRLGLFFEATRNFLNIPMEGRGYRYHTTLTLPHSDGPILKFTKEDNVATLPIKAEVSDGIRPTLPYGIYCFNPAYKNHVFVTSSTLLSFSGISESFHVCPADFDLRRQMHESIHQTMWELNKIVNQGNDINFTQFENEKKPELPKSIIDIGKKIESNKKFKKIAWMEIRIFEKDDQDATQQQDFLIDSILKSGEDLYLWISFNPQMYLSPIAANASTKDLFLTSVVRFTRRLRDEALIRRLKIPKILIGFEIANNFNQPHFSKKPPLDLYGNDYYDIPNPLDRKFWETEIKTSLDLFLKEWKDMAFREDLAVSGIVIDLEMYRRRTTGSFLGTMGFERKNLDDFGELTFENNVQENIRFLFESQKVQKFFNFLEQDAAKLGRELKDFLNEKIPGGIIGCYAPNISIDWFYKGFYKGICDKNKPLQLLTFNAEFNSYDKWLQDHEIYAEHSTVLMLSKLKEEADFKWVDFAKEYNSGIWFNRWSHFIDEPDPAHKDLEKPYMSKEVREKFFDYVKSW